MTFRKTIQTSLAFTSLLLLPHGLMALDLFVSPDGKDSHSGTETEPLASIEAARDIARESGRIGLEDITVHIQSGTYQISDALRFTYRDGGTSKHPVTYQSAGGGEVVITGAQLLSTDWKPWKNGIYRTQIKNLEAIDQLFVNGLRQRMARYPNYGAGYIPQDQDPSPRGQLAGTPPYTGCTPDAWDASKAKNWSDPTGAFMHGMHSGLWGSQHYRVLGKDSDGNLVFEGGWQNNRARDSHKGYRMIENVFEELDAPGEWYHDTKSGWLYYRPANGIDLSKASVEAVLQLKRLLEIYGEFKRPVSTLDIENSGNGLPHTIVKTYETKTPLKGLHFKGIRFAGTARTFMETKEPLLRGDWAIYRGGAIHIRGTENVTIENCTFRELGGNAVFIDGYNRETKIIGNIFQRNGASDVNVVGSFSAVRDPAFNYSTPARPLDEVDSTIGPKTDEYPADCLVENNLMERCGRFEKQTSGINISMASRITARHNTISHTPRAAININDGTWGGHLIEWNDCFETVLETHDHGAFNSWGRDRYWHRAGPSGPDQRDDSGKALVSYWIETFPDSPLWDAFQTTIIRNNRMQCDHGWDIDLDDGSTNYEIYDNLCLSGGLKTREGYKRIVTNNIVLGRGYTCNVPYPKPTLDIFERNILWGEVAYRSSNPELWGGTRNQNFVHNPESRNTVSAFGLQQQSGDDASSLYGNADFVKPTAGDFSVRENSPALKLGFKNFPMTGFGVTSAPLRAIAGQPNIHLPETSIPNSYSPPKTRSLFGARFKTLNNEAELSATGMHRMTGTLLLTVPPDSLLATYGLKTDDVVLRIDESNTDNDSDFIKALSSLASGNHTLELWRGQEAQSINISK